MAKNSKTDKRYLANLEKHRDKSIRSADYSLERFDVLIISLATSGLVLSVGFVKDVVPNFHTADLTYLKYSWLLFAFTLIANLFSQATGFYNNSYESKITQNLIRTERGKPMKGDQAAYQCKQKWLNKSTMSLNGLCLTSFVIGVILLIIFLNQNI